MRKAMHRRLALREKALGIAVRFCAGCGEKNPNQMFELAERIIDYLDVKSDDGP
jgi:hypothetical protein